MAAAEAKAAKAVKPKKDFSADIDRLSARLDALAALRETFDTRFSLMSEKIGEIRSMVLGQERESADLRKKAEKAVSMVEETHPESLYAEFKKKEAEINILKDRLASTDEMTRTIMEELRDTRRTINEFKGIEGIMKLSEDVRNELIKLQKVQAEMDKQADKVGTIFIEIQRRFKDMARVEVQADTLSENIKSLTKGISNIEVRLSEVVTRAELEGSETEASKLKERTDRMTKLTADISKKFGRVRAMETRVKTMENAIAALTDTQEAKLREGVDEMVQQGTVRLEEVSEEVRALEDYVRSVVKAQDARLERAMEKLRREFGAGEK